MTQSDYNLLADTAILAGEIMLKSGAEVNRVEDTIQRILEVSNLKHVETVVMGTCIIASISNPDMNAITVSRRVHAETTNLGKIDDVNEVSRKFCSRKISLKEAFHQLKKIEARRRYSNRMHLLASMMVAFLFCILFGGSVRDLLPAILSGTSVYFSEKICSRKRTAAFITSMFSAFILSMIAFLIDAAIPWRIHRDEVITGTLMLLVPGLAITNASRDILMSNYISGAARLLEALILALAVALGTGIALFIMQYII